MIIICAIFSTIMNPIPTGKLQCAHILTQAHACMQPHICTHAPQHTRTHAQTDQQVQKQSSFCLLSTGGSSCPGRIFVFFFCISGTTSHVVFYCLFFPAAPHCPPWGHWRTGLPPIERGGGQPCPDPHQPTCSCCQWILVSVRTCWEKLPRLTNHRGGIDRNRPQPPAPLGPANFSNHRKMQAEGKKNEAKVPDSSDKYQSFASVYNFPSLLPFRNFLGR